MEYKKISIEVVGGDSELMEFVQLCRVIALLGAIGAHRVITLHVDGDGTGRLRFKVNGDELPPSELEYDKLPVLWIGE